MTVLPERLLTSRDEMTPAQHKQAAEDLLGAARTLYYGHSRNRRALTQVAALAQMAQAHATLAAAHQQ